MKKKKTKQQLENFCKICKKLHHINQNDHKIDCLSKKKKIKNMLCTKKIPTKKQPNHSDNSIEKTLDLPINVDYCQTIPIRQVNINKAKVEYIGETNKIEDEAKIILIETEKIWHNNEAQKEFEKFFQEFNDQRLEFQNYVIGCCFAIKNNQIDLANTSKIFQEWIENSHSNILKQTTFLFGFKRNKDSMFGIIFSNLTTISKAKIAIYQEMLNLAKGDYYRQIGQLELYFVDSYFMFKPIGDQVLSDGICVKINNFDNKKIFLKSNSVRLYDMLKKFSFIEDFEELTKKDILLLYISSKKFKDNYFVIQNLDDFKNFTFQIFCKKKKISWLELLFWIHHLRKYSKQQKYDDLYNTVPISKKKFVFAIWQKIINEQKISYTEVKKFWNLHKMALIK